jgi:hypothetical protein
MQATQAPLQGAWTATEPQEGRHQDKERDLPWETRESKPKRERCVKTKDTREGTRNAQRMRTPPPVTLAPKVVEQP